MPAVAECSQELLAHREVQKIPEAKGPLQVSGCGVRLVAARTPKL